MSAGDVMDGRVSYDCRVLRVGEPSDCVDVRLHADTDLAVQQGFGIFIDPSPTAVVGTPPSRGIQDHIMRTL